MYHSKEIRWFFKEQNEQLLNWFEKQGLELKTAPVREDHYYSPSLSESMGIKLREGRLEVKQRTKGPYEELLFSAFKGHIEEWIKWSFKLDKEDVQMKSILADGSSGDWLKVRKARILVKIGMDSKGAPKLYIGSEILERGCQIEYSNLQFLGRTWYSFGLEWFGQPWIDWQDTRLADLIGREFLAADAQSYPMFLLEHV